MTAFVDTNVLVYAFDDSEPEKRTAAWELLKRHGAAGELVLSTQVLQEFFVTVTRKLARPLPLESARDAVQAFAEYPLAQIDRVLLLRAIERHRVDGFSFWDALIVEAALEMGCKRLYSEDLQHGRRLEGMKIVDPFC